MLRATFLGNIVGKRVCFGTGRTTHNRVNISSRLSIQIGSLSTSSAYSTAAETPHLPKETKVVICGGGIIGCSVAYHLAIQGWKDIVLLEQGSVTCGTTWHSVGLIGRLRDSSVESEMADYSSKLYAELEKEGYGTGWKKCGSLNVARSADRLIAYKRALLNAELNGVKGEIVSPKEIQELCPLLRTDDLEGGIWIPDDGVASAPDVAMALAKRAKEMGVQIFEKVQVQQVLTENEKISGVKTNVGQIDCQYFVNSSGQWARELGQKCKPPVAVPLHPCEHFYIVTKPVQGVTNMMPVIRDYDGYVYAREWGGGILGGGFEPQGKPVFHEGIPENFEFQLLPEDWDHFQILLEQLLHRIPDLENAEVKQMINGPESFTPDGKFILGEAPEVQNYYVAAGMNSSGIQAGGGVGRLLAEWIIEGTPAKFVWNLDVRRFVPLHNNRKFLKDRVKETLGNLSWLGHNVIPDREVGYRTGRKLRTSPIYTRFEPHSPIYSQIMGYERVLFFNTMSADREVGWRDFSNSDGNFHATYMTSDNDFYESEVKRSVFGKPAWFDKVKSEYWACREGVCLIDMSTFTKFELRSAGREVVDFLQYVCSNDVDRPIGTIIHTGMQNHKGGYENDCSIVRLEDNRYFMIGPTAQQTRAMHWLNKHIPKDKSVQLSDVTSMYTAINVIGPKAQELLQELTDTSLSKADFPLMTCTEINVGQASSIKAMRLTHSGEDGWMLYIPSEYALHVYDSLMAEGKNFGIRNAGYYALRALRTEKFFAYWGTDLTPYTTPMECGRDYRVKFEKGDFIGHDALWKQKEEGVQKKLVQLLLENHDSEEDLWPWGGEPIYRNGVFCGVTSSTAFGFTLDRHICLGYVHNFDENGVPQKVTNDFIVKNAKFEVDIAGKRFPTKAGIYPPRLPPAGIIVNSSTRPIKSNL